MFKRRAREEIGPPPIRPPQGGGGASVSMSGGAREEEAPPPIRTAQGGGEGLRYPVRRDQGGGDPAASVRHPREEEGMPDLNSVRRDQGGGEVPPTITGVSGRRKKRPILVLLAVGGVPGDVPDLATGDAQVGQFTTGKRVQFAHGLGEHLALGAVFLQLLPPGGQPVGDAGLGSVDFGCVSHGLSRFCVGCAGAQKFCLR